MASVAEIFVLLGLQTDKSSFKEGLGMLQKIRSAATALVGVEAVRSLVGFVEHAAEAGTHILGMSTALAMSSRSFQEWSYVAKKAGSDGTQFATGVSMFERNLLEFSKGRGGKRFRDAMADIHMSATEAKATLAGPDGVNGALFKVADAYKEMGNTGKRAAINTGLFGQRARGMAQDLSQGSAALKEQIQHLHDIGGVIDDDKLQNLKKLNNGILDMKTAFSGLATQTIGALAPALADMANSAAKWIAANKDLISGAITAAVKTVAVAFEAVATVISTVGDVIRAAMGGDTGAEALLIGIAVAIGVLVLPALASMAVAVIAATWPFVLIIAAVTAIAFAVLYLIKNWDKVKAKVGEVVDWVSEKWNAFVDWVESVPDRIESAFKDAFTTIGNALSNLPVIKQLIDMYQWATNTGAYQKLDAIDNVRTAQVGDTADDMGVGPGAIADSAAPISAMPGRAGADGTNASGGVNITAPLTVNITGVKDAAEAVKGFDDSLDNHMRHAAQSVGGQVQ